MGTRATCFPARYVVLSTSPSEQRVALARASGALLEDLSVFQLSSDSASKDELGSCVRTQLRWWEVSKLVRLLMVVFAAVLIPGSALTAGLGRAGTRPRGRRSRRGRRRTAGSPASRCTADSHDGDTDRRRRNRERRHAPAVPPASIDAPSVDHPRGASDEQRRDERDPEHDRIDDGGRDADERPGRHERDRERPPAPGGRR